jgi:hypothetical protein
MYSVIVSHITGTKSQSLRWHIHASSFPKNGTHDGYRRLHLFGKPNTSSSPSATKGKAGDQHSSVKNLSLDKDRLTIQQQTLGVQNDLVATVGQQTSDIPRRLEFSELQETLVGTNGFTDQFGGSGFTLSSNNDGLLSRGGESGHECPVVAFIRRTFSWMAWSTKKAALCAIC